MDTSGFKVPLSQQSKKSKLCSLWKYGCAKRALLLALFYYCQYKILGVVMDTYVPLQYSILLTQPPCSAIQFAIFSETMNRQMKPTILLKNPLIPLCTTVTAIRYPKHNNVMMRPQLTWPSRNNLKKKKRFNLS